MARIIAFVALAAATVVAASADTAPTTAPAPTTVAPGDFQTIPVDANVTALLTNALANDSKYAPEVKTRLCYSDILRVQRQVVAGYNTRYHVTGCEVATGKAGGGKCLSSINCAPSGFMVSIFTRTWDGFEQIRTIEKESSGTPSPLPRPSCGN